MTRHDPIADAGAPRSSAAGRHTPVMLPRIVELLAPSLQAAGSVAVDGTLGMGGHSEALLRACPAARVVGIDRDRDALRLAGERLAAFGDRFTAVHAVYDEIPAVLDDLGLAAADAVLFDLGISSLQVDELDRGFSYRADAPLDMRMDRAGKGPTAADVLNSYAEADLVRILTAYGEERFARRIARAVVAERAREEFTTSARLVALVHDAVPAAAQASGGHPAKRTFQALRIEVNSELTVWGEAVTAALQRLRLGGRIAVLSYHSLEDRITKQALVGAASSTAPLGLPVELEEHRPTFRLLTRGAERPTEHEQLENPRSASARLRAAERVRESQEHRR